MARAKAQELGPVKKWWRSKHEHHFQAYTAMTLFFFALALFCFIFLFFMDGVLALQEDGNESLTPLVWLGLLGGSIALFIVAPEFFYFLGQKQILEDILELDSRPEVLRRRKDAEQAADLLGQTYQARLKGLYEYHGIKFGKKYTMDSLPPRRGSVVISESNSEEEE